jgi:hypothetical protein
MPQIIDAIWQWRSRISRYEDDWHFTVLLFNYASEFFAPHPWQKRVGNDGIKAIWREYLQGSLSGVDGLGNMTKAPERFPQHFAQGHIVIDDQDSQISGHLF